MTTSKTNPTVTVAGRLALLAAVPVLLTTAACRDDGMASPMNGAAESPAAEVTTHVTKSVVVTKTAHPTSTKAPDKADDPTATTSPPAPAEDDRPADCVTGNLTGGSLTDEATGHNGMDGMLTLTNTGPACTMPKFVTVAFSSSSGGPTITARRGNSADDIDEFELPAGASVNAELTWTSDYIVGSDDPPCDKFDQLSVTVNPEDAPTSVPMASPASICDGKIKAYDWYIKGAE